MNSQGSTSIGHGKIPVQRLYFPELDGRFAVFGKVISGMNIVDLIEEEDFIIEAIRVDS